MDIIRRLVVYLKHDASETGFCLSLRVKSTQVLPIEKASLFPDWIQVQGQGLGTTE
jgi:hypothetical protein